jgi:hypothetical protein
MRKLGTRLAALESRLRPGVMSLRVYVTTPRPFPFGVPCSELEGCRVNASGRFETHYLPAGRQEHA